jgi:hypothetical protein
MAPGPERSPSPEGDPMTDALSTAERRLFDTHGPQNKNRRRRAMPSSLNSRPTSRRSRGNSSRKRHPGHHIGRAIIARMGAGRFCFACGKRASRRARHHARLGRLAGVPGTRIGRETPASLGSQHRRRRRRYRAATPPGHAFVEVGDGADAVCTSRPRQLRFVRTGVVRLVRKRSICRERLRPSAAYDSTALTS